MQKRSKDLLRMDRRLIDRPGWMTPEEIDQELAALPDVSDKIDDREENPSGEPVSAPQDSAVPATPVLGEPAFSPPAPGTEAGSSGGFGDGGDSDPSV